MKAISIEIPRLNDRPNDFNILFNHWRTVENTKNTGITFRFTNCDFLRQNAVAFIGGLIRLAQHNRNNVNFALDTLQPRVRTNLEQNGFLYTLGFGGPPWDGNSIPYREDTVYNHNEFTGYLSERWLGRGWLQISDTLKRYITQPVIEAYINVFDHANSPIGVITCGQHYPNLRELTLTMVDFGVGIPHTVRTHLNQPQLSSVDTLRWVFQPGATTKNSSALARGLGLKLLKSFIKENRGNLEIYSDTAYVCITRDGENFQGRSIGFRGTLVQLTLQCDAKYYTLPSEEDYDSGEMWF